MTHCLEHARIGTASRSPFQISTYKLSNKWNSIKSECVCRHRDISSKEYVDRAVLLLGRGRGEVINSKRRKAR